MEDHAKTVAERWARKRAAAIADGMKPETFDAQMLYFMRWGGWSEENAQAICKRAKQLHEKGVTECEQS